MLPAMAINMSAPAMLLFEAWRLTEEPKEVDVYGSKVEKEGNDA